MFRNSKVGNLPFIDWTETHWIPASQQNGNGFELPTPTYYPTNPQTYFPIRTPMQNSPNNNPPIFTGNGTVRTNLPVAPVNNPCANTNCLTGSPVVNLDGSCGCTGGTNAPVNPVIYEAKQTPTGQVIYYQLPANPTHTEAGTFDGITEKIKANPLLAIGGAVVLGFLVFGGKK